MRQWRNPPRVDNPTKALAWLKSAPRTSRQISELLDITINHACVLLRRMHRKGQVQRLAPADTRAYRYRAV